MTASHSRWVALLWLLAMGALVLGVLASAVLVPDGMSSTEAVWGLIFGSVFLAVGTILVIRRPAESVAWLCLAAGLLAALSSGLRTVAIVLDTQPGPIPLAGLVAAQLVPATSNVAALVVPALLLARIPSGRDHGKLAAFADAALAIACLGLLAGLFVPGPMDAPWLREPATNPIGIEALGGLNAAAIGDAAQAAYGVGVVAAAAILVRRYRRAGPVVRAQIRWVAAAGIVPVVLFVMIATIGNIMAGEVGGLLWTMWILSTMLLPIAIGIAMLRYRLYAIDRIISRTIAYAILTGLLGATFVVTIIGVQALLSSFTQSQTIAVAASTLVAFALFQPLRHRVQAAVDRRFDRARVDGERTAAAFRDRLRHEVEISTVADELLATIDASVRPATRTLWLRGAPR